MTFLTKHKKHKCINKILTTITNTLGWTNDTFLQTLESRGVIHDITLWTLKQQPHLKLTQWITEVLNIWLHTFYSTIWRTRCKLAWENSLNPTPQPTHTPQPENNQYTPTPPQPPTNILGFPHRQIGIDFIAHYNRMADRAEGLLNHCTIAGAAWPPYVRLAIVKSFIRPALDYGAPLAAARLIVELTRSVEFDQGNKWFHDFPYHHLLRNSFRGAFSKIKYAKL